MKASILVHNLNRAADLRRCLSSIATQTQRPLEVVVLDAGSTDGSAEVIAEATKILTEAGIEIRYVLCERMGVAASRNAAAGYASGDVLVFIDNDACFDSPSTIDSAIRIFQSTPNLAVLSFRVLDGDQMSPDPLAWVFRRSMEKWGRIPFRTFTFAGTGFAIRRHVFQVLHGFWNCLQYSREEEELSLAVIDAGWDILYSPLVVVRHYPNKTGRFSVGERRWTELRNGILVMWRRLPIPIAIVAILARIVAMTLKIIVRQRSSPAHLLSAVPHAACNWRDVGLQRLPISFGSVLRYAALHFTPIAEKRPL